MELELELKLEASRVHFAAAVATSVRPYAFCLLPHTWRLEETMARFFFGGGGIHLPPPPPAPVSYRGAVCGMGPRRGSTPHPLHPQREMTHPDGGFFSAQDADSMDPVTGKNAEGAFYMWSYEEVKNIVRSAWLRDEGPGYDCLWTAPEQDSADMCAGRGGGGCGWKAQ